VIDDECASAVCDAGTCAAESTVVYAAPDGHGATSACTRDSPCDLTGAIAVATTAISPPILRLLPGIYTQGLAVADSALLRVVATGATLTTSGFTVGIGADVAIRGATINVGINCTGGGTNNVTSHLAISDSSLLSASQITTATCVLDLNSSEFAGSAGMTWRDRSKITLDGVHAHTPTIMSLFADGLKITVTVTNSVLENVDFEAQATDTSEPGSTFSFAFNTWVPNDRLICRDFNVHQHILFENNIIASKSALSPNVIDATACVVRNNVLQPQASPPAMNIVSDPQFVDAPAGNFHLKPTSPAIDKAQPSASLGTDHDFDGIVRPQGPALDIGAFELPP
jgi:hypothetical protein